MRKFPRVDFTEKSIKAVTYGKISVKPVPINVGRVLYSVKRHSSNCLVLYLYLRMCQFNCLHVKSILFYQ